MSRWIVSSVSFALAAAVLCSYADVASGAVLLDRESVAKYARTESPVAKANATKVDVAKAGTVGVGIVSQTNPTLTAMGGVRFGDPKTPEANASLLIPFDLGGRPKARSDAAATNVDAAKASAADGLRGVVREALLRWARALRAQRGVALAKTRKEVASNLVVIAKRRAATGDIAKGDTSVFEIELGREDARLSAANGLVAGRRMLLVAYIGAPEDAEVGGDLVAISAPPSLDTLLASIDKRADVQAAAAAVTAAGAQVGLAKSDAWPTLGIVGNYEYHESTNFVTVGVSLPLPLFNTNKTAISTANAKVTAAQADLAAVRALAIGELKAAYASWTAARDSHDALAKVATLADVAVARAVKAYDVGSSNVTDVLLLRKTLQDASTEALDAELALAEARIELDAAAGTLP